MDVSLSLPPAPYILFESMKTFNFFLRFYPLVFQHCLHLLEQLIFYGWTVLTLLSFKNFFFQSDFCQHVFFSILLQCSVLISLFPACQNSFGPLLCFQFLCSIFVSWHGIFLLYPPSFIVSTKQELNLLFSIFQESVSEGGSIVSDYVFI